MNVVIPFHNGDANLAIDLVKWIKQLGGIGDGCMILCVDAAVSKEDLESLKSLPIISTATFICGTSQPVKGWPQGSNALLSRTLDYVSKNPRLAGPWLWLEPDAIPLKVGWLDEIRKEYAACGKRYMGNVYVCNNPRLPNRLMSGIGVYPADAKKELEHFTKTHMAWDVEAARFLVENCAHTKLIYHFWGIQGMPPTFAATRTDSSPPNTFTLQSIHKDAVIFHRNKDGTLLKLLSDLMTARIDPTFIPFEPAVALPESSSSQADIIAKIRQSAKDEEW